MQVSPVRPTPSMVRTTDTCTEMRQAAVQEDWVIRVCADRLDAAPMNIVAQQKDVLAATEGSYRDGNCRGLRALGVKQYTR